MFDLDLTSPGHSRSKQMPPNERFGLVCWGLTPQQQPGSYQGSEYMYDFLSIIKNKFGHICKGFQVTALSNMPDLDLTFPGQSMTSYPSPIVTLWLS